MNRDGVDYNSGTHTKYGETQKMSTIKFNSESSLLARGILPEDLEDNNGTDRRC